MAVNFGVEKIVEDVWSVLPRRTTGSAGEVACRRSDRPEASTLNFAAGQTIANGATIKLGTGGTICVYTDQATDLLLDVTGFVPAT